MDLSNPAVLIRHRLRALGREDRDVGAIATAMHRVIETLYQQLVERGWEPCDALSAVLMEISDAQDELARRALPD
jgi:hypothetical protein